MLDSRLKILTEILEDGEYKTAGELAEHCDVSEKTVRMRLKDLSQCLTRNGARLVSKKGMGYRLMIDDRKKYMDFVFNSADIPSSPEDRIQYIMVLFINQKDYIKKEKLCEFLFVSERTLTTELRKIENIFEKYGLSLDRRPFYGMKLEGKEFDKRRCMLDYLVAPGYHALGDKDAQEQEIKKIGKNVLEVINRNYVNFSEMSFKNLIDYIYIAAKRMRKGYYVENDDELLVQAGGKPELQIAEELMERIKEIYSLSTNPMETFYVGVYIAGKRNIGGSSINRSNFIIEERIDRLVFQMLQEVYSVFKLDFRDNFNLRMLLNQHTIPLDVRMTYGIPLKNSLLEEVKEKYMFAYTVAKQACIPLQQYYHQELSEDEISYYAILFALALEQQGQSVMKKNVLLVCVNGKASSQLLMYRLKKEFGEFIEKIYISNLYEISKFDFRQIDYVFTTVPLPVQVNVPIVQIHDFLEDEDIMKVKRRFMYGDNSWIETFYTEELFFTGITGETKEAVLSELCQRINGVRKLPDGFYQSVLEREDMGNTDYGNFSAIPHPHENMLPDNLICVGILEKPILWVKNEVQLIVLVSIADSMNENTQKFYEATMKLLMDKDSVREIITKQSYETFIAQLDRT